MKRLLMVMICLGFAGVGVYGQTASTSTVIKVTCVVPLSVSIDIPEYDFGNMGPSATAISVTPAVVKNDSLGRIEDYRINSSTWTGAWNIDSDGSPGAESFSLQALFASVQPAAADFGNDDYLDDDDVNSQNMKAPAFGTVGYDGDNVNSGATRNLWFRMHTPSSTAVQSQQTITVTVTAVDAGTF